MKSLYHNKFCKIRLIGNVKIDLEITYPLSYKVWLLVINVSVNMHMENR